MEAFRGPQSYTKQHSQFYPDISSGLFHMATFISSFTWSKLAKTRGASGRGNWNSTYIDDSNHYDNGDDSNDNVEGETSNLPWLGWGHIRPQASWSRPHVPSGQLVPFMVMMILQMMAIFAIIIIIIIFIAILLITIILPGMLKCNVEILLIVCKIFNNCFVRSIVDEGKVAGKKNIFMENMKSCDDPQVIKKHISTLWAFQSLAALAREPEVPLVPFPSSLPSLSTDGKITLGKSDINTIPYHTNYIIVKL